MKQTNQKRALICGAGGFIGGHLCKKLKSEGYWVRGVDVKKNPWMDTGADEFIIGDLRHEHVVDLVLDDSFNEVYQLACLMGGAGFIFTGDNDADIMHNSALIDLHVCGIVKRKFLDKGTNCTVFYSSSACFTENTPIFTSNGSVPIQKVNVGDMVLTHTGEFKKVTKCIKSLYKGMIANVNIHGLPIIQCTPNHPFFVLEKEKQNTEWKKIEDFKENEFIHVPKPIFTKNTKSINIELPQNNIVYNKLKKDKPHSIVDWIEKNNLIEPKYHVVRRWNVMKEFPAKNIDSVTKEIIEINDEFGELFGTYLAEGWCEKSTYDKAKNLQSRRIVFAFGEEPEFMERTKYLLNSVFGVPHSRIIQYKMKGQKGHKIHVTSDVLYNFFSKYAYPENLQHHERNCYTKKIHEDLMVNNIKFLEGLIKGHFEGDGCFNMNGSEGKKNGRYIWSSTSNDLIHQLREILLSVNVYTSFQVRLGKKDSTICGRKVNESTSYHLYTIGYESLNIANKIIKQTDKIDMFKSKNVCLLNDNYYSKVKEILYEEFDGFVYNMEVEDNHSYTVYGVSVHNCIYPSHNQLDPNNPKCSEDSAYPANPDSEYGNQKLFSERLYLAFNRNYKMDVRVARFHNIFGPNGSWNCGREKAPAAICRKVAMAPDGGEIEIWGDGVQTRSFLYIDECIEGVRRLMNQSEFLGPVNIGSEEMVSINQFANMIIGISGKTLSIKHIEGPTGVRGRNSDNKLIEEKLGWKPSRPLIDGLEVTYKWISQQIADGIPDYQYQ